jgi:hypothetical protein
MAPLIASGVKVLKDAATTYKWKFDKIIRAV